MTPNERFRWAQRAHLNAKIAVIDAAEALEEAEMEYHYARFVHAAASIECPTCKAKPGSYCAIFQREDGSYSAEHSSTSWRTDRLLALFLHPARTLAPAALAVA